MSEAVVFVLNATMAVVNTALCIYNYRFYRKSRREDAQVSGGEDGD